VPLRTTPLTLYHSRADARRLKTTCLRQATSFLLWTGAPFRRAELLDPSRGEDRGTRDKYKPEAGDVIKIGLTLMPQRDAYAIRDRAGRAGLPR
jgi:hypothetical protein